MTTWCHSGVTMMFWTGSSGSRMSESNGNSNLDRARFVYISYLTNLKLTIAGSKDGLRQGRFSDIEPCIS